MIQCMGSRSACVMLDGLVQRSSPDLWQWTNSRDGMHRGGSYQELVSWALCHQHYDVVDDVAVEGGSFRHFLWHVAKELEYGQLDILVPSPSALGYKSSAKYLLSSDNLTFSEEKIYQFFGQVSLWSFSSFNMELILKCK